MRTARAVIGLLLACHATASAQGTAARVARNAAYLELFGNGGLISLNYERKVADRALLRVGGGSWTSDSWLADAETTITAAPLLAGWLYGKGPNFFELGGGALVGHKRTTAFGDGSVAQSGGFVSLTGTAGYRRERALSSGRRIGQVFRAGFTPLFGLGDERMAYPEKGFFASAGVSYGLVF